MLERSKNPTATEIRGLNEGADWQYGRALARAWTGHVLEADSHFDAAMEQARSQGQDDLYNRLSIHRLILQCRCELRPHVRRELALALMARLRGLELIEDYRPPFQRVPGRWLAESLENDITEPGFLIQALPILSHGGSEGLSLGNMLVAKLV